MTEHELRHPRRGLELETAENVRDLGGYTTSDGRATQWNRFVRSGDMIALSEADQERLLDYGIKTVIDLRMAKEYEVQPNVFAASDKVRFHNHDFWGTRFDDYRSWRKGASPEQKLADLYCSGLEKSAFVMADIMTTFAETDDHGFAFHCRSGKDRTGLVAALLLTLAGVPRETICADFALTAEYLPDSTPTAEDLKKPGAYQKGCSAETMTLTLTFLDDEFGGVEEYLARQGLTDAQLTRIRSKLLD
jgi:protein-tyrosine phosphatase